MDHVTAFERDGVRQVQVFPAPVCRHCRVPKWLRSRVSYDTSPWTRTRLSFVCPECGDVTKLHNQIPIPWR
jgi:hypothetical protein